MRIVAPLLVVLVFVGVGLRLALDPVREYERERIDALSGVAVHHPARQEALLERIDRWIERAGDDAEALWYAAAVQHRLGRIEDSIDTVWGHAGLREAPGTARRLGALLLRNAGFARPEALGEPGKLSGTVAILLAEGGDEQATEWLESAIATNAAGGFFASLYGTFLYATEPTRLQVAAWLRKREEHEARVMAALAAMRAEAYPDRANDLSRLEEATQSALRWQERFVWSTACVALGSSEDTRSLGLLVDLRRRLADLDGVNDAEDAVTCAAGELAGGWWQAQGVLRPFLGARGAKTQARLWYGEALLRRLAREDPMAPGAFEALWDSLRGRPDPPLEARLATALLLKDGPPHPGLDVDGCLASLETRPLTADRQAVAAAFRCRRGEEGSLDRVIELLKEEARRGWIRSDPGTEDRILVSPILTLARALYLYDPTL